MLQADATTTTPPKRQRRKLPTRKIVDAELVSSKTDSARIMDDLLLPSEHDRIILSEIFDVDKENRNHHNLPRVVLGVPKKRDLHTKNTSIHNKTYKERLKEHYDSSEHYLDLSGHSIIPTKPAHDKPDPDRDEMETDDYDNDNDIFNDTKQNNENTIAKDIRSNKENIKNEDSSVNSLDIKDNKDTALLKKSETITPAILKESETTTLLKESETTTPALEDTVSETEQDETEQEDYIYRRGSIDSDHCFEQQVMVVIENLEYESEEDLLIDKEIVSDEGIKHVTVKEENQIESPKPKLAANVTPFSQDIKTQVTTDTDSDSEWMDLDSDTTKDMSEEIYNMMHVGIPTVAKETIETIATVPDTKTKRLRSTKALDWIENTSITNNHPKPLDNKTSKRAHRRIQRLTARRTKPYITRKRFKRAVWE